MKSANPPPPPSKDPSKGATGLTASSSSSSSSSPSLSSSSPSSSSACFYYATSQPPTAVTHACVGSFISEGSRDLVIAKSSRIEVYRLQKHDHVDVTSAAATSEAIASLEPIYSTPINGRVGTMNLFRLPTDSRDYLIVTTELKQICVIKYDTEASEGGLITIAGGDLRDRIGSECERGQLCRLEPNGKTLAIQYYDSLIKFIPSEKGFGVDQNSQMKPFNLRIGERDVLDFCFLYKSAAPTLCVLYKDEKDAVNIRTYLIALADKALRPGPWSALELDGEPEFLIPVPAPIGGVLVVGRSLLSYISPSGKTSGKRDDESGLCSSLRLTEPLSPHCFCVIDSTRFLIADKDGSLFVLAVVPSTTNSASSLFFDSGSGGDKAKQQLPLLSSSWASSLPSTATAAALEFRRLGETVIASTISYLDDGYVHVGSVFGDSQLIRLKDTRDSVTGAFFDVVSSYTNIGPIVDMAVVDLDRQGQGAVVTCSGTGKEGSLRVVRNGIGIEEHTSVDLPGIRSLFTLRASTVAEFDKYLVHTYANETRAFSIEGETMDEVAIPGFVSSQPSLLCATVEGNAFVQVITSEARLVHNGIVISSWLPPAGSRITVASSNLSQLLIALSNKMLILIEVNSGKLVQVSARDLPHEVSALNINPLNSSSSSSSSSSLQHFGDDDNADDDVTMSTPSLPQKVTQKSIFAAVGLWGDFSLRILHVPSLEQVAEEPVGTQFPVRSTLLASVETSQHFFFAGLGDGHLLTFRIDAATGSLTERKKVPLGRTPVSLSVFKTPSAMLVFCACDRPTVVYSQSRKLVFSNVNLSDITSMVPFHTEDYPHCLALASPSALSIGMVNEIQKLHVKKVPLNGEAPRRIAHHKSSKTLVVALEGEKLDADPMSSSSATATSQQTLYESVSLRLFDDSTFEQVTSVPFELDKFEVCLSLTSVVLGLLGKAFIVVGTAYILEDEEESSKGRILVLDVTESGASSVTDGSSSVTSSRRFQIVSQEDVKGAVYSLASLISDGEGKLVATIGSKVQVYKWIDAQNEATKKGLNNGDSASGMMDAPSEGNFDDLTMGVSSRASDSLFNVTGEGSNSTSSLRLECGFNCHILALTVDTRGDFILVGDLMRSVMLLRYNAAFSNLEETATEPGENWMTAVALADDCTAIGAEHHSNLFLALRNPGAANEDERVLLRTHGFYAGEFINKFRAGSLVMLPQELVLEDTLRASALASSSLMDQDEDFAGRKKKARVSEDFDSAKRASAISTPAIVPSTISNLPRPRFIFGAISGAIGVLISLPQPLFSFLVRVQIAMAAVIEPVGTLSHAVYRGFRTKTKMPEVMANMSSSSDRRTKGFIDGDLLELFLDLNRPIQEQVVALLNGASLDTGGRIVGSSRVMTTEIVAGTAKHPSGSSEGEATIEEVLKTIEDLSRLH